MDTEELKEGDLVEHLASGERGVITDEETSCMSHQGKPFSCVGHPDSCDYQPTGYFSLSLGFEKNLYGVSGDLLCKIEPGASTTWDTGKSDILDDIARPCESIRRGGPARQLTTECQRCGTAVIEGLRPIEYLTGLCLVCANADLKKAATRPPHPDFNKLRPIYDSAREAGVGFSFTFCEGDSSFYFCIDSPAPTENWTGKNHSFDIAVESVCEWLDNIGGAL